MINKPIVWLLTLTVAGTVCARDIEPREDFAISVIERAPGFIYRKPVMPVESNLIVEVVNKYDQNKMWDHDWVQHWSGDILEGSTEYCQHNSYRQEPITGFDINLDGYSEILLPISCYQGEHQPEVEKHNRAVRAAWRMFCSDHWGQYEDCTQALFDANEIEATITEDMGGIPYIHVADTGYDINNDGFPDLWFAVNRDDGRPHLDPQNPDDHRLHDEYCGVPEDNYHDAYKCTWKSLQSVLLSNFSRAHGIKYDIVQLPWEADLFFDMVVLPNTEGTVDIFIPVEPVRAARLTTDNQFVDVSAEYETYKNIAAVVLSSPYIHTFANNGIQYYVHGGVQQSVVSNPNANTFEPDPSTLEMGFTVWQWIPGIGFELSDFYTPPQRDRFTYRQGTPENFRTMRGAYLRGIPVYDPKWHFFDTAQLRLDEPLTLVVVQEAGTTFGKYFGEPHNNNFYYELLFDLTGDHSSLIAPLSVIQGFHIIDGKIHERAQSVVDGDVLWNTPSIRFTDMNRDRLDDMYGTTGHNPTGSIYINDGTGTLDRIDFRSEWPYKTLDMAAFGGFGGVVRDLGMGPYLHFLQFGGGVINPSWDWPEFANGYPHPDFMIREALLPVDAMPVMTPEQLQQALEQCTVDFINQWFYSCEIF